MSQLGNPLRKMNIWGGGGQGREQEGGIEWWKQASNSQHGNAAP